MKRLDEVIKRVEVYRNLFSVNGCFECHYRKDDCIDSCFLEDVLYYLNTIETTENLYHDAINELSKLKDEDWKDRCLPLTWDELKLMEGEPVWIELLYHHPEQKYEYWDIIKCFDMVEDYELIVLSKSGYLYKDLLDKEWKAYRRGKK